MAFRSGLEERVADLLCELGVKYEYESTKFPMLFIILIHLTFFYLRVSCWNARDIGMQKIAARLKQ